MARLLARMNAFNFTKVFFNPKLQYLIQIYRKYHTGSVTDWKVGFTSIGQHSTAHRSMFPKNVIFVLRSENFEFKIADLELLRCLVVYLHLHCWKISRPQIPQTPPAPASQSAKNASAAVQKSSHIIQIHSDISNFLLSVHQEGRQSIHTSDHASYTHRGHAQNICKEKIFSKNQILNI